MPRKQLYAAALALLLAILTACAPAAPSPTAVPPKPTEAVKTAPPAPKPTEAPVAKPTEAKPAAKPTEAPAAKPTARPTDKPAAKPAFDEKAVADFYRGKTVRMIVGFAAGGSYDVATRLVARHLGKYIPGNPNVIVENKPGASGLIVANEIYKGALPNDGTVMGTFNSQLILQDVVRKEGIEFDSRKLQWIGSMMDSPNACAVRLDAGINSMAEVVAGKEFIIGAVAVGSTTFDVAAVLKAIGANIKIVPGYSGTATIRPAVEKNEVQGMCTQFADLKQGVSHWFESSPPLAKFIFVAADKAPDHPWLKGVQTIPDVIKDREARLMMDAVTAPMAVAVPYAVAPEVPRERVAALRLAFEQAVADKEFWADAEKANFDAGPSTGDKVDARVKQVFDSPPSVLEKLKPIMK